jgi:hypothetical protein
MTTRKKSGSERVRPERFDCRRSILLGSSPVQMSSSFRLASRPVESSRLAEQKTTAQSEPILSRASQHHGQLVVRFYDRERSCKATGLEWCLQASEHP